MSFRYLGLDAERTDAANKAIGQTHYIHDLSRPGMLFGKIKFSEHAHARILNIDTSKAEALPGVRAVLTAANTPEVRLGFLRDNFALKRDKVRAFRDEVAAVAAIDPDIAAEAVELIEVEYEPLPGVFDPHEALAPNAPLVHDTDARGRPVTTNRLPLEFAHESGDLDDGRSKSVHIVSGTYTTPLIQQTCMGTAGCIAEFDTHQNLTIWAKTQIPFLAQRDFNRALADMGLKGRNSRVIVPALGGGFGTGLDTHVYEYLSILLAYATGRPVKVLYNRDEEFANLSPRQSSEVTITQGCDAEGNLTFRDIHVLQDNGAYASWGATYPSVMLMPATSLYRVQNVRFASDLVYTNNTYAQAMRGYGNPELTWALESNLDDLATAANIDPVDIRLRNCNQPGETTPMGLEITTCALDQCLEQAAATIDWDAKRAANNNGATKKRGVGLASLIHVGGSGRIYRSDASGIILRLDDYGNLYVYSGSVEMGQGLHTAVTRTLAEATGITPDHIFINQTDTATCPWDVGTHASRGAFVTCNAAILAAAKLHEKLFSAACDIFPAEITKQHKKRCADADHHLPELANLSPDDFHLLDNRISLKSAPDHPCAHLPVDRLLRAMHFTDQGQMITVEAFYDPPSVLPDWEKGYGNMSACYTFGTQAVEVEVDTETGDVTILDVAIALDVGRVLHPKALIGQTLGALAQGIGYALYEKVHTSQGRIQNPNFTDYKIPTAVEMDFPVNIHFHETNDPHGPFGAKGIGEPGLTPTAPAISNAIFNATGIRLHHLPMTPESIVSALKTPSS